MKTAIITGGAHGIGKAIAQKLLQENYRINVLDVNPSYIDDFNHEFKDLSSRIMTFKCDVGDADEVKNTIEKIVKTTSDIDCLINNAGISKFEPIETLSIESWNKIISVNLSSIFYCVKYIKPHFSEKSAIVNISSTRAFMSEIYGEAYGATKGGIISLTHALANSLGPKTRVNSVSPGWIEVADYNNLTETDHSQHPAGRVGKAEDIAETVAFLLSDKAEFITGQNITVDGGMTKKMIYI